MKFGVASSMIKLTMYASLLAATCVLNNFKSKKLTNCSMKIECGEPWLLRSYYMQVHL